MQTRDSFFEPNLPKCKEQTLCALCLVSLSMQLLVQVSVSSVGIRSQCVNEVMFDRRNAKAFEYFFLPTFPTDFFGSTESLQG